MKMVLVYGEPPTPPIHGGRVDVYRRILALQRLGVELLLICWHNPARGDDPKRIRVELDSLGLEYELLSYGPFWRRPLALLRYPGWIAARLLGRSTLNRLSARIARFSPEALLIDGLPCAAAGLQLSRAAKLPYLYRSHNVEHRYVADQARFAADWKARLRFWLNLNHLKRFESEVIAGAVRFYDISEADLAWWRSQGFGNGHWLPPVIDEDHAKELADEPSWQPVIDVGYFGNLTNPNNVEGVVWFVERVVPHLRSIRPDIKIQVAGSNPDQAVLDACATAGVALLPDPPSAAKVLRSSRVLVNPVFQGSGVNLKAIEMLHTPAGLVSTSTGTGGLPKVATQAFTIADSPEDFATAIIDHLAIPRSTAGVSGPREAARRLFAEGMVKALISKRSDFQTG